MSQTQNVTTRRRRAAPVIPGRCGICNTQDPHRQYLHPPNNEILAVFRRISYQATMAHFYCDGCILRAEKKLDQDRRKRAATGNRSATVAAGLQRSAGNAAPHRTTNVTGTSSQSAESQELQPIRQPEAQLRPLTRSSIDAAYPPANDRSTAASDSGSLSSESTNTVIGECLYLSLSLCQPAEHVDTLPKLMFVRPRTSSQRPARHHAKAATHRQHFGRFR